MLRKSHPVLSLRIRPNFTSRGDVSHLSVSYTIPKSAFTGANPHLNYTTWFGNFAAHPYSESDIFATDTVGRLPFIFVDQTSTSDSTYAGDSKEEMVELKKPAPFTFDVKDDTATSKSDDVPLVKPKPFEFAVEEIGGDKPKEIPVKKPKPLTFSVDKRSIDDFVSDEGVPTRTIKLARRGAGSCSCVR